MISITIGAFLDWFRAARVMMSLSTVEAAWLASAGRGLMTYPLTLVALDEDGRATAVYAMMAEKDEKSLLLEL